MSTARETDPADLALARIRVALDDIAPEIPDEEIVPDAHLVNTLRLDTVSIWSLGTALETLAKTRLTDAQIRAWDTVGSVMADIASDPESSRSVKDRESVDDVMAAAADLAKLLGS